MASPNQSSITDIDGLARLPNSLVKIIAGPIGTATTEAPARAMKVKTLVKCMGDVGVDLAVF